MQQWIIKNTIEEGELPKKILEFAEINPINGNIILKKYPDNVLITLSGNVFIPYK